ncbi:MAG: glycerophosphodiester phosphodiesterase [Eubacteriales bacterium]
MQTGPIFSQRNSYRRPLIIAHRGCNNYAPQNSLPAFLTVAKMGVWAIETDIHLTRDGVAVCIHDPVIETMTDGVGTVSEMTFEELSKARINRGVGADTTPPELLRVPKFDEYLDICMRYGCVPFIEFKTEEGVEVAVRELRRRGMLDYAVASSVKFEHLEHARRLSPEIFVHYIFAKEKYLDALCDLGYAGLSLKVKESSELPEGIIGDLHERGLRVCLRAADTRDKLREMIDLGLDYQPSNCIFTPIA